MTHGLGCCRGRCCPCRSLHRQLPVALQLCARWEPPYPSPARSQALLCSPSSSSLLARAADVILKYTADEARSLKTLGQLPESVVINDTADGEEEEGGIEFADDSSDEGADVDIDAI